jgi:hypothetical protein
MALALAAANEISLDIAMTMLNSEVMEATAMNCVLV